MLLTLALLLAPPAGRVFTAPIVAGIIEDRQINESSGLAPSFTHPGEVYTNNDSGDSARFFRIGRGGNLRATYTLKGVQARDWEDIATATLNGKNYIYLGDIGDNESKANSVVIYRVEEPVGGDAEIKDLQKYEVTYPGGPRNAETLMVDPKSGDIWVVEKKEGRASIYRLRKPANSGRYRFERKGTISFPDGLAPMRLITGGSVAPDRQHLVLRTYAYAYEFPIPGKTMDSFLKTTSQRIQTPPQIQGEAICYTLDSNALMTTSEGNPCVIWRIPTR